MYGRGRPYFCLSLSFCHQFSAEAWFLAWDCFPGSLCVPLDGRLISQGRREEDYLVQAEDHLRLPPAIFCPWLGRDYSMPMGWAWGDKPKQGDLGFGDFVCFLPGGRGLSTPWLPAPQCQPVLVSSELPLPLSSPFGGGVRVQEAMGSGFIM